MNFRNFIVFLSLLFACSAFAGSKPYEQKSFEQAQKDGKSILVMIHATWCPTCKAQAVVVDKLAKTPEFAAVSIFRVDYDDQEDVVRAFHVQNQSALIVFKGSKEITRAIGITHETAIATLMRKGL